MEIAATGAVSHLKIRSPSHMGIIPLSIAFSASEASNPPSLPTGEP